MRRHQKGRRRLEWGSAVGLVLTLCGACASARADPLFVDRGPEQNFRHVYDGGWEHFVGGGVAAFDCNGDRLPDLFVAGGDNPAKLLVNRTGSPGAPLTFEHVASPATDLVHVTGAYPLDVDSDGRLDLFVLRVGENRLFRGLGGCRFEDSGGAWGFDGSDRWSTAFSATWEEGRVLPTLAVGNYVDRDDPEGPFRACDDNELHRSQGHRYGVPLILGPGHCALSMLISDWGRRGKADLRISNDRHYYVRDGEEQLVRLEPVPRFYGEADGWKRFRIWGMGIASRDLSGDGLPEIFLTSMSDQKLLLLEDAGGRPTYRPAPYESGTTAHMPYLGDEGRPSSGWHAEFGDFDNDGRDDLFIAKGNVDQMPDAAMKDPNNLLMQLPDGTFAEAGAEAGLASMERGRGAAIVDLDGDGRLDIVVVNRRADLEIHQNVSKTTGNWLQIALRQKALNRQAVGAFIEVKSGDRTWTREITVGGGHAGGRAGFEHFGIGDAREVAYRVIWPDGETSAWRRVPANRHLLVTRGAGAPEIF